ncbi:hypothetical protein B0T18DRAFT_108236 [Schizothecium vesticola]|uniref:Uncharacterized protein n=1 Tax=Schizothecium vesticola TaxID=314040 RepID=A0AA40F1W2_9PEZI|nr:hypothetical protein B0T18DRAFT_108236 [Schizothecium vesticola]
MTPPTTARNARSAPAPAPARARENESEFRRNESRRNTCIGTTEKMRMREATPPPPISPPSPNASTPAVRPPKGVAGVRGRSTSSRWMATTTTARIHAFNSFGIIPTNVVVVILFMRTMSTSKNNTNTSSSSIIPSPSPRSTTCQRISSPRVEGCGILRCLCVRARRMIDGVPSMLLKRGRGRRGRSECERERRRGRRKTKRRRRRRKRGMRNAARSSWRACKRRPNSSTTAGARRASGMPC